LFGHLKDKEVYLLIFNINLTKINFCNRYYIK
jgi:hypothetical protein